MAIHQRMACIITAALLAAVVVGGCSGEYRAYKGKPKAFSTHPYRVLYPAAFSASEPPQASAEMLPLSMFVEEVPISPNQPKAVGMIVVRAHRMREQETPKAFMERYYDDLAPRFLEIEMVRVAERGDEQEWTVTVEDSYLGTRVLLLPRERLAYDVVTLCASSDRERFKEQFARARDSFRLLRARR
ncbi:MAG: hypothetical protein JSV65_17700 [Armatimonadota bacterium]|nr:MAG: hypothetical protein JSV65_17700 [Armatimonadota bacterium]